jgi:hypothetical protein
VVFFEVLASVFFEDPVFALLFDFFDVLEVLAAAELVFADFLTLEDAPLEDEDFGFAAVFFEAAGFFTVFFAGFFVVFSVKLILLNGPPRS